MIPEDSKDPEEEQEKLEQFQLDEEKKVIEYMDRVINGSDYWDYKEDFKKSYDQLRNSPDGI